MGLFQIFSLLPVNVLGFFVLNLLMLSCFSKYLSIYESVKLKLSEIISVDVFEAP